MGYEIEVVRDRDRLAEIRPEWCDFLAQDVDARAFASDPHMVDLAVRGPNVAPFIILVRRGGRLECIAPFCVQPSPFRLMFSVFRIASFPSRLMSLIGDDFVYAKGADATACCAAVFGALNASDFDLAWLHAIDVNSPLWSYCESGNGKASGLTFSRPSRLEDKAFFLQLPPTLPEYLSSLGSSTRSSLKRRTKKLLGERSARLVKVTAASDVPWFLSNADQIFADSWQAKTYGTAAKNCSAETERLQVIADHGWLQSYLLVGDMGPLAFQYGYRYGDAFYACDFAYAQEWSSLGPGAVLMYLMIEDLYRDRPPKLVDLGAGDSPQKHTFRGAARSVADCYAIPRNRWRHIVAAQRCLSSVEASARSLLVWTKLDARVRRLLKHKH